MWQPIKSKNNKRRSANNAGTLVCTVYWWHCSATNEDCKKISWEKQFCLLGLRRVASIDLWSGCGLYPSRRALVCVRPCVCVCVCASVCILQQRLVPCRKRWLVLRCGRFITKHSTTSEQVEWKSEGNTGHIVVRHCFRCQHVWHMYLSGKT